MHFALSDTQVTIQHEARRFLTHRYPPRRIGELSDSADDAGRRGDRTVWPLLRQLGWLDRDAMLPELALVAGECGRGLLPAPWWVSAGAARCVFTAAGVDDDGPAALATAGNCRASTDGGGWRLDGTVCAVPDAGQVTDVVVPAVTAGGTALFRVAAADASIIWRPLPGPDPLRVEADATLRATVGQLLIGPGGTGDVLRRAARHAEILRACEAVGVAEWAVQLGVEHARTRRQFDRIIGSFQAVAHPLADSYAAMEFARSLAYRAACEPDDDAAIAAAAAAATGAALQACETAIQVCGGMGVTWEFPLHRWYRRALWHVAYQAAHRDPFDVVTAAVFSRVTSGREPA